MEENNKVEPAKQNDDKKQSADNTQEIGSYSIGTVRKTRRWLVIGGVIILVLILIVASLLFMQLSKMSAGNGGVTGHQSVKDDGNKVTTQEEEDIASVASKVSPSVVSITTKSGATSSPYFGTQQEEGAGTGVIVSKDGYIMTNKHVIDGANTVSVILSDGTSYDNVKILGTDPLNDVAFLKVDGASNLPAIELGDSTTVRVGQKVVAIGNSLGQYQNTVTSGIISGTGRPVSAQSGSSVENLTDLLQTDAAINPGNSGGPLLNLKGQMVGINTAIAQDAQGIGFAIPINSTKGVLKSVLAGKGVQRAYIGVNFIPITADVAKYYNLPVKKGAYVYVSNSQSGVVPGGPADKAGVKDKDIITKVGGIAIGDQGGMASLVGEYAPGDTVQLTVLRGGQTMTINVTLEAYQSNG